MVLLQDDHFAHRANSDGTTDTICTHCYVTVCTSTREADLAEAERRHICDPIIVGRWKKASGREDAENQARIPERST